MGTDIVIVYKILGITFSLVAFLCIGHVKWMLDLKKTVETRLLKLEDGVEKLRLKQTRHENIFVTEQRTREVFREEIAPLKDDIHTLKEVITEVRGVVMGVMDSVSSLVTEVRIINAVKESHKKN